jgi:O-antigen/teichoic acid export membrane protein
MPLQLTQWLRADKTAALAGSALRSVLRVAAAVTVARMTDAHGFASFVTLTAIETIGTALAGAAISNPLITLLPARGKAATHAMLATASRWGWVAAAIFGICGWALARGMLGSSAIEATAFSAFVVASTLSTPSRAKLTAGFSSRVVLTADAAGASLAVVTVWSLALAGTFSGNECVWIALAAGAALTAWILRRSSGRSVGHAVDPATSATATKDMKRLAVPMVIGSAGVTASSRLQPFALEAAAGASAVAVFGAAQSLAGPLRLMSMSLSGLVRPRLALHLAKGNLPAANRALLLSMAPPVLVTVLSVPVILLAGHELQQAMFGTGIPYSTACLLGMFIYAALEAVGANLTIAVQTFDVDGSRRATVTRLVAAAAALAMLWPAATVAGAAGSAWSLAIVEAFFAISLYASLRRAVHQTEQRSKMAACGIG